MTAPAIYAGPRSDEWETPAWIFNPLHDQYRFAVDLAATKHNTKTYKWLDSFLTAPFWDGVGWCNPPFSLASEFFAEIATQSNLHSAQCVAIYKSANMETKSWRHIFSSCSWIAHPHKRVNYLVDGVEGKGAQFASAVIGWNVPPPRVPWKHTLLRVEASR